ncbi:hypothetical protein [Planococcus sp. YIM B11945]|uniref:hypothetical protein n=1 Tax=Planococcus sp. YIM B11945 TaxID=3435410 RepID=UPI003D7DEA39
MFKINRLSMTGENDKEYSYNFKNGINYFKGKNSSGKTEFYNFIDYMFGSSQSIENKAWFKDSLKFAIMEFEYNEISYLLKRTLNKDVNYFRYKDEDWGMSINLSDYKDKINSVFTIDFLALNNIREFSEENLSYRTFTIFNFLGEKTLGNLNDFFTKSKNIQYSTKLSSVLNYIFNDNLKDIFTLKKELKEVQSEINMEENSIQKYEFVKNNINLNLKKIDINLSYNGKNKREILSEINKIKLLEELDNKRKKPKTISELESIYNSLTEQIKVYLTTIEDNKKFEIENENRKKITEELSRLIIENDEYKYLIEPIQTMVKNLDRRISFNKHVITNNTVKDLKKQRQEVKDEIILNNLRTSTYEISEKSRFLALVEEYLNLEISYDLEGLKIKHKEVKRLKEEIKRLQNSNDEKKIDELSSYITSLYKSASDVSDIIKNDTEIEGFYIQYYKKGNLLQPKIINTESEEKNQLENYYVGSMARHTLIQFCGYLGFLDMLIKEKKYPLIPILIIDHISKPFDSKNRRAIGAILQKFYKNINLEDVQIFLFDDKDYKELSILPNHSDNLVNEFKTGFNPFFHESSSNK